MNENIKEYLMQYRRMKKRIILLEEEERSLRIDIMSTRSQQSSDMPGGGVRQTDLSDLIAKMDSLLTKIIKYKAEALAVKQEIRSVILTVSDPDEARLLSLRYLELLKWEEICVKMNYSWKQIHRIHSRALSNLLIMT